MSTLALAWLAALGWTVALWIWLRTRHRIDAALAERWRADLAEGRLAVTRAELERLREGMK